MVHRRTPPLRAERRKTTWERLRDYLEDLRECAPALLRGAPPTLSTREFAMSECDASVALADHGEGRRRAGGPKIEAGLRREIRVPPPIEDDARDIAPRIEAGLTEQRL